MNTVSVTADDATHLRVSIDVVAALNAMGNLSMADDSPLQGDLEKRARDIADEAQNELDAKTDLTVAQVIADFHANTLKSFPPKTSVKPGTGMGTLTPATEAADNSSQK